MTHELIYTSAPKGLKPGSRGFSTVAQTRHTPGVLAESLEALSGYKFAFPMGSSQERLNPVAYSHFILSSGGIAHHVLSRVSAAPPDYTGRSNKLAHHLVLTPAEAAQLPCGPAALMKQPDFFKTSWSGEPHWIEAPRSLKACEATTSVCSQWKKTTGDAGWAGKLAEQWQSNLSSPLFLVFPEGLDVLPLVEESLSLLPPADRWRLTFSTYFTSLPAGVRECSLRCILAGSEEHQKSLTQVGNRIVDLTKALPSLETSSLVDDSRNGTRLTKPSTIPQIPKTSKPPAIKSVPTNGPPPPVRIEVVEDATWEPPDTFGPPTRTGSSRHNRRSRRRWAYPLIAAITALLLLAVGSFFLILRQSSTAVATTDKQPERPAASNSAAGQEPKEIKEAPPPPPVATESESVTEHPPHEEPAEANTKQGQPTEAGTPKEKEAKNVPQEEQKKETGGKGLREEIGEQRSPTNDQPGPTENRNPGTPSAPKKIPDPPNNSDQQRPENQPNAPSDTTEIALIKKNGFTADGIYKPTKEQRDRNSIGTLRVKYPEDYIFIACSNTRTTSITLRDDKNPILTFMSTPVVRSNQGKDYEFLKSIKVEFSGDDQAFILVNDESEPRIKMPLTKGATWADLLSKWREQDPSSFPKSRQDLSQDAINITSQNSPVSPGKYFAETTIQAGNAIDPQASLQILISTNDPEADLVTVKRPAVGKSAEYEHLGRFEITESRIEWSGKKTFSDVKKNDLKTLFFIISKEEALPCHDSALELIKLKLNSLGVLIIGKLDELKKKGDKSEYFDILIPSTGNIDPIFDEADSWLIDKKSLNDDRVAEKVDSGADEKLRLGIIPTPGSPKCYLTVLVMDETDNKSKKPKRVFQVRLEQVPVNDKEYRDKLILALKSLSVEGRILYEFSRESKKVQIVIGKFAITNEGS